MCQNVYNIAKKVARGKFIVWNAILKKKKAEN